MEWTSLNDLREKYLAFFEEKGHLRLPSFSLVPQDDNSLLLINSGMAPMKKYFTGEITPPRKRVTTCQKCIRTPDIERVGKTARHGTYFEMLGNFSFGDYFKEEATAWAWEFCTQVLELPLDKLWVTIYQDDDQAYQIWTQQNGVAPERIVRLGKEDNFWEHGSGPCGPCSEIYFDRGEKYGCGAPDCAPGCECDRFTEFWNLVFTQFDSDGKGNYDNLEHPNIDTGMGLERLACIMQGVDNLFEVDTVQNIMKHIMEIAGVEYHKDENHDVSLRVITDHIRSSCFMISDGVMPSKNGRGYVLRRLIRRASRHGRLLGITEPFLYQVAATVIKENERAYPNLKEKQDLIVKILLSEEEAFGKTIDAGLELLERMADDMAGTVFSGENAFKLNDTFGFPLDLTKEILAEKGITVDEAEFQKLLEEQKQTARNARKDAGVDAWAGKKSLTEDLEATAFVGYTAMQNTARVIAVLTEEGLVQAIGAGESGVVVLNQTVFYAQSGGQAGDTGVIEGEQGAFAVTDTTKNHSSVYLHTGKVTAGSLSVGDTVTAQVDVSKRESTMRNHTAAHLLQAALRRVLGTHVVQAGQLVNGEEVRFDFTHFAAMTMDEIKAVEDLVNDFILSAACVDVAEMSIDEARKLGAMALFGEKYGDMVRVVKAGDFSTELCGGTHVNNAGKIGLFKIISESSVASGVRRIQAVTGKNVIALMDAKSEILNRTAALLKAGGDDEVCAKVTALSAENKEKEKEIVALNQKLTKLQSADVFDNAKDIHGIRLITAALTDVPPDALRALGDDAKALGGNVVAVLAGQNGGKANFVAVCGEAAIAKGAHAGNIVREVAKLAGGGGGGRPDSAMAGAKDLSKIDAALGAAEQIVCTMLK